MASTPHLSGISFPGRTIIFHGDRVLTIGRTNDGDLYHKTRTLPVNPPINPVLLVFPAIDLIMGILLWIWLTSTHPVVTTAVARHTTLAHDPTVNIVSGIVSIICYIGLAYFLRQFARAVAPWHGLEHMLIQAAQAGDLAHAERHSHIALRCGTTYMLGILIVFATYSIVAEYLGMWPPVGIYTAIILGIMFEDRFFHAQNWRGIRLGIWLQEKFLTCTPPAKLLEYGKTAMTEFMAAQNEGNEPVCQPNPTT